MRIPWGADQRIAPPEAIDKDSLLTGRYVMDIMGNGPKWNFLTADRGGTAAREANHGDPIKAISDAPCTAVQLIQDCC